ATGGVNDAVERGDVGVIAADGQHHVVIAGKHVVGRIKPAPANVLATSHQHTCVHGVRAFEVVLLGVEGSKVAADIGSGQSEAAQSGNHDVGEVLANAAPQGGRHWWSRRRGGDAGFVNKVGFDPPHEIDGAFENRASRRETLGGISAEFRVERG